jgi:hypothetical protein
MKRALPYLLVAIAAIGFVVIPRLVVHGMDDFTLTADNHKAFIYGFPFRITDCPPSFSHTPASAAALRLAGNFLIFFMAGTAVVLIIGRAVRNLHQAHE